MTFKRSLLVACAVLATSSGCGNYSNDDLDFELALPEQTDMEAKLQVSLVRADSAEYYRDTRSAVLTFNGLVAELTGLVDTVRGYTPSQRNGNQRIWGPFPDTKHAGWEIRVVMQRGTVSATLLRMDYWVEVRPVGQGDSSWVSLLVGQYTSQGSARAGWGKMTFDAQTPRAAGYPVDADASLDHLDACYNRSGAPSGCSNDPGNDGAFVDMQIVNLPTAQTQAAHYTYELAPDESGKMQFSLQTTSSGIPVTATMRSRWQAGGAGRADLVADLTPNVPGETTLGTDCWGPDTVATYSSRLGQTPQPATDDPSTCVF